MDYKYHFCHVVKAKYHMEFELSSSLIPSPLHSFCCAHSVDQQRRYRWTLS